MQIIIIVIIAALIATTIVNQLAGVVALVIGPAIQGIILGLLLGVVEAFLKRHIRNLHPFWMTLLVPLLYVAGEFSPYRVVSALIASAIFAVVYWIALEHSRKWKI